MAEATANIRSRVEVERANRKGAENEARAKDEDEIKEKAEKMRNARETKAKAEDETTERARAWADDKAREKADIYRIAAKDREKTNLEARVSKNANVVNILALEAASNIRFSANIQGSKR